MAHCSHESPDRFQSSQARYVCSPRDALAGSPLPPTLAHVPYSNWYRPRLAGLRVSCTSSVDSCQAMQAASRCHHAGGAGQRRGIAPTRPQHPRARAQHPQATTARRPPSESPFLPVTTRPRAVFRSAWGETIPAGRRAGQAATGLRVRRRWCRSRPTGRSSSTSRRAGPAYASVASDGGHQRSGFR